jgi:hypothetical protein
MSGITAAARPHEGPIYREPPAPARFFVYAFALCSPLLTLFVPILPGALVARYGTAFSGIAIASVVTLAYVIGLWFAVRRSRRLASRFTPPLALPGDIWNIGVAEPPRRSRNWPIRLMWRRPPDGRKRLAA